MNDINKRKWVAYWLLTGVAMIIIQTLLGGVTRLTGSGLSITKWDPLFGALPPMNEQQWNAAFDGYKKIGQFKFLNSDYTLSDFKAIFFWEWLHRVWARLLCVVFIVGFVWFLYKRSFDKKMIQPFVILFLLGAMQGLIGWIMVASGLNDEHLYVDHIKLALHFVSAMVLACYTLWFALMLLVPEERRVADKRNHNYLLLIIVLLFVQLTYGAFMAGLKAATAAATWPTINGMWLPDTLSTESYVNNKINVHFIHRGLAYIILIVLTLWFVRTKRATQQRSPLLNKATVWPVALVAVQVLLGIITVLSAPYIHMGHFGTYELLAELHQMTAMFLLVSLVVNLYIVKKGNPAQPAYK